MLICPQSITLRCDLWQLCYKSYHRRLVGNVAFGKLRQLRSSNSQFLLKSYQSLYPDHVFDWTMMVETMTMGRCHTPKIENIESLLCAKQCISQNSHWLGVSSNWICKHLQHFQCFKNRCIFYSCAACQFMWKLLPSKFGVIMSHIWFLLQISYIV